MMSLRAGRWPTSNRAWRLSLSGVPRRRKIGIWQVLRGVSKSYLQLIIKYGMVTCGTKLRLSASGGKLLGYSPPPNGNSDFDALFQSQQPGHSRGSRTDAVKAQPVVIDVGSRLQVVDGTKKSLV